MKTIYFIELKDGRKFNIFCENKKQSTNLIMWVNSQGDNIKIFNPLLNGIHKFKEFKEITKYLYNEANL